MISKIGKLGLGLLCGVMLAGSIYFGLRLFRPHPAPVARPATPALREPVDRASRELQNAYDELKLTGVYFNGEMKGVENWRLNDLLKQSRGLYNRARGEYEAGNFARAGAEARAGVSVAHALRHLSEALTVPAGRREELLPPPSEGDRERRAFDRLGEARRFLQTFDSYSPLIVDPNDQNLVSLAREIATRAYHRATDEISAERFERGESLAQAVRELSEVAEHLGAVSDAPPGSPAPSGVSKGATR